MLYHLSPLDVATNESFHGDRFQTKSGFGVELNLQILEFLHFDSAGILIRNILILTNQAEVSLLRLCINREITSSFHNAATLVGSLQHVRILEFIFRSHPVAFYGFFVIGKVRFNSNQ